jgi:hypothetical protein
LYLVEDDDRWLETILVGHHIAAAVPLSAVVVYAAGVAAASSAAGRKSLVNKVCGSNGSSINPPASNVS